jgi:hypothetical protein
MKMSGRTRRQPKATFDLPMPVNGIINRKGAAAATVYLFAIFSVRPIFSFFSCFSSADRIKPGYGATRIYV